MYAVTKGDITIREMKVEDVVSLVRNCQIPTHVTQITIQELKDQIRKKTEESDLLFVIIYKNKMVGKIDIIYNDDYLEPEYKGRGFKTSGNMIIEIPPYDVCMEIADKVADIFVEYCKETAFVDVLGIPKTNKSEEMYWEPLTILEPRKTA